MIKNIVKTSLLLIALVWSMPVAQAEINNISQSYEHMRCIEAIGYYEKKYNLPKNLLYAISIVESGSKSDKHGVVLPWPWTLNISGSSYFYQSPEKALVLLRQAVNKNSQVDVGCAQINWHHHGHHFKNNPQHIFNPVYNVAYAAHFLTNNYLETKQWSKAVAYYHSRSVERGAAYANKVMKIWNKINNDPKYQRLMIKNKTDRQPNKNAMMLVYKSPGISQTINKASKNLQELPTPIKATILNQNDMSDTKSASQLTCDYRQLPTNQ